MNGGTTRGGTIRRIASSSFGIGILAATFACLWMLYVPLEYAAIVTAMAAVDIRAGDYRIRSARRRVLARRGDGLTPGRPRSLRKGDSADIAAPVIRAPARVRGGFTLMRQPGRGGDDVPPRGGTAGIRLRLPRVSSFGAMSLALGYPVGNHDGVCLDSVASMKAIEPSERLRRSATCHSS